MESLGGFQLVRLLGAGSFSDVWLGSDGDSTAAIKVFRSATSRDHIDSEVGILSQVSSRHTVSLTDLALGPDGRPVLILERLSHWSLATVLERTGVSAGEAVTILAPLCSVVSALHRAGITHGRVRAASVLFDDAGAPVLASFGEAMSFVNERESLVGVPARAVSAEAKAAVEKDLDGLANLCESMLGAESDVVRWISASAPRDPVNFPDQLAERLFELASPAPVRTFGSKSDGKPATVPSRVDHSLAPLGTSLNTSQGTPLGTTTESPADTAIVRDGITFLHVPKEMLHDLVSWWHAAVANSSVRLWKERIAAALRPVRKPVWIMAALVATGVVVAVTLLPSGSGSARGSETAPPPGERESPAAASPSPVMMTDDPVAAAFSLLQARQDCFRSRSVLCLDGVDQPSSTARESDEDLVRALQEGGAVSGSALLADPTVESSPPAIDIALVERLGDSALLSVTVEQHDNRVEGLSLLVIKLEDGWRIRDIVTNSPTRN